MLGCSGDKERLEKSKVIVLEPWSKQLTRLSEDSEQIQNNIPIFQYKPSKLSKGPKGSSGKEYVTKIVDHLKKFQKSFLTIEDSLKTMPTSDKITVLQNLTNRLVNDVGSKSSRGKKRQWREK